MSKIVFTADCHIANHKRHGGHVTSGLNKRCLSTLDVFERALSIKDVSDHFHLGDLLDDTRPSPQVLTATMNVIKGANCNVHLLLGNHEQVSMNDGDHALGPLTVVSNVMTAPKIWQNYNIDVIMMPFNPGSTKDWLPGAISEVLDTRGGEITSIQPPSSCRVLCLHLGICDTSTPAFLRSNKTVDVGVLYELCKEHDIRYVLAGDWHNHKHWSFDGVDIYQVGALCPTGWDNPGLGGYGTVVSIDTDTHELSIEFLSGPRFIKTTPHEGPKLYDRAEEAGHTLYVQVIAPPRRVTEYIKAAKSLDDSKFAAIEVVPDKKAAEKAAKISARAVTQADTINEAVASYVEKLPTPQDISNGDILNAVRRYLHV